MNDKYLLIGGPLHGDRRSVTTPHLVVPHHDAGGGLRTFTYERRRIHLANHYMNIMAPRGYSDGAITRALADFIEGTSRP
jgi:hypothetical protein